MGRFAVVALAILALPILAACGDDGPREPDHRKVLQESCFDKGGAYFEYEATSAGAHIWCVTAEGAEVSLDGSE